jgi:hypothetical protein
MEKGKVIKNDITDKFLDDDYQYADWVDKYGEFLERLVEQGGLSSDY